MSTPTRPDGSIPNASSAAISLWAPRLTHSRPAATSTGASRATRSPALMSWRAASPSPTRTFPARTSDCARDRVGASPRSTRSWSRRTRLGDGAGMTLSWHTPLTAHVSGPRPPRPSGGGATGLRETLRERVDERRDEEPEVVEDHPPRRIRVARRGRRRVVAGDRQLGPEDEAHVVEAPEPCGRGGLVQLVCGECRLHPLEPP